MAQVQIGQVTTDGNGRTYVFTANGWQPMEAGGLIAPQGAMPNPTNIADLRHAAGGDDGIYQRPFFPTAPRYYKGSGKLTRDYTAGLVPTDADYAVGTEATRVIRFDIPGTAVAVNGAAFPTQAGNAFPIGIGPRGCWLFRMEYTTGERLQISERLAELFVGTAERPGEIGGDGWEIDQGAAMIIGITPLMANLRIDLTLITLEQRGKRNFWAGK